MFPLAAPTVVCGPVVAPFDSVRIVSAEARILLSNAAASVKLCAGYCCMMTNIVFAFLKFAVVRCFFKTNSCSTEIPLTQHTEISLTQHTEIAFHVCVCVCECVSHVYIYEPVSCVCVNGISEYCPVRPLIQHVLLAFKLSVHHTVSHGDNCCSILYT